MTYNNSLIFLVTVNLFAKWQYTPLHLEAGQYLASENKDYFWKYINHFHSNISSTEPPRYPELLDIVKNVLEDDKSIPLFEFSLAQRIFSPAIAAHEQIAHDRLGSHIDKCLALLEFPQPKADVDTYIVCNTQDAEATFKKIEANLNDYYQPTIYKNDHIYYAHSNAKAKDFKILTAVLYGEVGSSDFKDLYNYCIQKASDGKMNFVVRNLVSKRQNNGQKISLGGYGIELAVKSTEYKAQDDARIKGEATEFKNLDIDVENTQEDEWSSMNSNYKTEIFEPIKVVPNLNESELSDLSAQAVDLILSIDKNQQLNFIQDLIHNFPAAVNNLSKRKVNKELISEIDKNQIFLARYFNIGPSDTAIFMNGMFFDVDSLDLFAFFEVIRTEFKDIEEGNSEDGSYEERSSVERFLLKNYEDSKTQLVIEPKSPEDPHLTLIIILDPLTRGSQKLIPILTTFRNIFNLKMRFLFNCMDKHIKMPLNNFYRFVVEERPNFKNGYDYPPVLKATFNGMPAASLLTMNIATPENWLVESVKSLYDLDNLHLAEIPGQNVVADFELEHLLLEGHCFDITTGSPPRGLQFVLGTKKKPAMFDTIVMANLGYFQLKASPGAWYLKLRHGKSADIYTIFHADGADFILHQDKKLISESVIPALLNDFRSRFLKLRVHKKKDQRHRDLLNDEGEDNGQDIWESIKSTVWSKEANENQIARTSESDRINVFSLASGHLYERLARIMMLSVLKHTKTPVKFWFLKNYLSPKFKDFLPYMAEKYNFDYEFVQYKWPRWLHQQSEKQRIIWGYKILFLDVLFPLDVKKIIFVDADQVVRTDLKELRDFDLGGAPYGYTPFCESRKDMDGYRFWKTGYWKTHLHNRKYHISALYVVDLIKFRRIAAGDRLRGQYQGLSQDPNSLSNLDQDLPNNMIHQVAIKSLPQEWLWCETWCSDDEKSKAKTIDLCNNPKTKEPKLTAARRIVKEWQQYDDEIHEVYNKFRHAKSKTISKNVFTNKEVDVSDVVHGEL